MSGFLILLGLSITGCGPDEGYLSELATSADQSPIRVALISDAKTTMTQIIANSIVNIKPKSFHYCLGSKSDCSSKPELIKALTATKFGTKTFYKIPENVQISQSLNITFYVTPSEATVAQSLTIGFEPFNLSNSNINFEGLMKSKKELDGIDYVYDYTQNNLHYDRARMQIKITNPTLLAKRDKLIAVLGGYSLKDTGSPVFSLASGSSIAEDGILTIEAEGYAQATPYQTWVYFHEKTSEDKVVFLGAYEVPFYFATTGADQASVVRAKVTTKAFAEAYDWKLNRYDKTKGYAKSWGWCVAFYDWLYKGVADIPRTNDSQSAEEIKEKSESKGVHGNNARVPGHTFMMVAFDKAENVFWTVEGNFNRQVLVNQRRPVGHDVGDVEAVASSAGISLH